ncbi:MAG: hypothetical protein JWM21_2459 [Acidobacteria bacterium]|nr:hypothetical protein [Acidobacteriota bacterium]
MRQNRRFGGINLLAGIAANILLLTAFGSGVADAQRRLADDSDVFKAQKQVREPALPVSGQGRTQINRLLPGANAPGIVRSDAVTPQVPSAVTAGPISNCVLNPGPQPASGHTCNVYETDASGTSSEISNVITIPNVVVGGFLVLKHDGAIADSVVSNWSDVLKFGDGTNANTTSMQFFSKGCNTGNVNDTSCFPAYSPGTSGFVTESNPGPTVFFNTPNTYNLYSVDDAPVRPWTTAGSTGAVDEDSLALVRFNSFGVNIVNGQTGAVHIRYPITAVEGVARLCPATHSTIRTRFRNSDNNGNTARVTYEVRTSSVSAGGNTLLYTFDSNGRGAGSAFKTATETAAFDFNFATNMYWIEATVFRSVASEFADLGTIQIWESAGTSCP